MLRPCAAVLQAHCYKGAFSFKDATASCRGTSRSLLTREGFLLQRCHGLVPWYFTLTATGGGAFSFKDATALCRGVSRSLLRGRAFSFKDATTLCRGPSRSMLLWR